VTSPTTPSLDTRNEGPQPVEGSRAQCVACDNELIDGQCPIHGDLTARAQDVPKLAAALHAMLPIEPGQWKVWVPNHFGGGSDHYINSSEFAARLAARLTGSELP
jgi:hypothetical protein